jgi:hypothetical protein
MEAACSLSQHFNRDSHDSKQNGLEWKINRLLHTSILFPIPVLFLSLSRLLPLPSPVLPRPCFRPLLCPSPCVCIHILCPVPSLLWPFPILYVTVPVPISPIFKVYKATSLLVLTQCSDIQSTSPRSNISLHLFSKMFIPGS